uniref:Uncharacterized protein n=1 Tax=Oryza glumipatula TaxID=40148 RepID=A0A0E0BJ97_9ORYZ
METDLWEMVHNKNMPFVAAATSPPLDPTGREAAAAAGGGMRRQATDPRWLRQWCPPRWELLDSSRWHTSNERTSA